MKHIAHALFCGACLLAVQAAQAGLIQIDQFGSGFSDSTPLASSFSPYDNGGAPIPALTYALPFSGVAGDLILTDPNFSDLPMEILIFPGNGTVQFFAGNLPNSLAFVASPPMLDSSNLAFVSDVGPEDTNKATYTPVDGQPGFDSSNPTYIIYNGVAGSPVPEPDMAVVMGLMSALGFAVRRLRRSKCAPASGNKLNRTPRAGKVHCP